MHPIIQDKIEPKSSPARFAAMSGGMSSPAAAPVRVGLFGIGLDAYWPQFHGLKDRLQGYLARVEQKLKRPGVERPSVFVERTR